MAVRGGGGAALGPGLGFECGVSSHFKGYGWAGIWHGGGSGSGDFELVVALGWGDKFRGCGRRARHGSLGPSLHR